ncbi:MAG: ROK family protein [Planctomycetia bacterium]
MKESNSNTYYIGVDVGGTKIQAALVSAAGVIYDRHKRPTPRDQGAEGAIVAIEEAIETMLEEMPKDGQLLGIGVAMPGVVDTERGLVVITPNMSFKDVFLGDRLGKKFSVPVAIGNDCNLGALGENWLGTARDAESVMAILVGTGVGGGFVQGTRLWTGARESASEVGHMVVEIDGRLCGCGNRGCLETLASRTAVERELREAVDAGRKTVLTEMLDGDLSLIRSSMLRRAIEENDELVLEVLGRAAKILGTACLTIRHLLDPEIILLGGGVVEACSEFFVPIVEQVIQNDQLPGARDAGHVHVAALGDDAVTLGAVALIQMAEGVDPREAHQNIAYQLPKIERDGDEYTFKKKSFDGDFFITLGGKAKRQKNEFHTTSDGYRQITAHQIAKACKGGPQTIFIGTGSKKNKTTLSDEASRYLASRRIDSEIMPTEAAVEAYNKSPSRRAAFICVG